MFEKVTTRHLEDLLLTEILPRELECNAISLNISRYALHSDSLAEADKFLVAVLVFPSYAIVAPVDTNICIKHRLYHLY